MSALMTASLRQWPVACRRPSAPTTGSSRRWRRRFPAVLGANDGLVSNFSLVMGVAGAEIAGKTILLTGLAGLIAGACSMAIGEWLSVTSSRELNQQQIDIEADELAQLP